MMRLSYLPTLTFSDKKLETHFQTHFHAVFIRQNRVATLLAIIIMIAFSPWDYYALEKNAFGSQAIRFFIAIPILIGLLIISFSSFYKNNEQLILGLFIYSVIVGIMALSLILVTNEPYSLSNKQPLGLNSAIGALNICITLFFSGIVFATRFYISSIITIAAFITYSYLTLIILKLDIITYSLYAINIATTSLLITYASFRREESLRQMFIINEQSNQLLNRVYPHSIVNRLKAGETIIADKITNASILFADLCDFTSFSSQHTPNQVVEMLNEIFSSFDNLINDSQIEKIKTIGDGYMVLFTSKKQGHKQAHSAINLALKMQQSIQYYNQKNNLNICLKVGIHSGNLIGGVIGNKRPLYDIWGDSVNIASRMETTCPSNCIQISEQTYYLLQQGNGRLKTYTITPHQVLIKGKGILNTYYISLQ